MTAPLDALLSFMLGGAIALACRVQLRLSPRPWYATRYFAALVGFNAMLVAPAAVYRYFFHPDWAAMYLVDASAFPVLFGLGAIAAVVGAGMGAFVLGAHCARAHREWLLLTTLAVAAAGIAVVAAVGYHRIRVVGSFEQWQGSFGLRPLGETDLLPALAVMGACMLAGWLHVLIVFALEGAAVRSASH